MGILEQTRAELYEAEDRSFAALMSEKDRIIDAQLADMGDLLTQPEFQGDLDTALIHHLGRAAFNQDEVKTFEAFAHALGQAEDPETPVLFTINPAGHPNTEVGANYTNLLIVDPSNLVFRSVTSRREGVRMHAFTDQTASVTDKSLSLVAPGAAISGDLDDPSSLRPNAESLKETVLSDSCVADDNAGGHGTYEFNDRSNNFIQLNSWGEPYVITGWDNIEGAVFDGLRNNVEGLLAFYALFNTALGKTGWKKQMPDLSAQIRAAQRLQPTTTR